MTAGSPPRRPRRSPSRNRADGVRASLRQLRAGRGPAGLVALLDGAVDRFEQRSVFRRSVEREYNRPVWRAAQKLLDLRGFAAGREHHVEAAARENRGQLLEGFYRRRSMSLVLEYGVDLHVLERRGKSGGGIGVNEHRRGARALWP